MIDSNYRKKFQETAVDPVVSVLKHSNITPNAISTLSLIFGLCYFLFMTGQHNWIAVFFLVASGYFDLLDGSLARATNTSSDAGCMLDIVFDRLVEFGIIIGLYLYDPSDRAMVSLFLLGSFYLCVTTFLLSGIFTPKNSEKSFHYSDGLIERTETFIFVLIVTLIPSFYNWMGWLFGILVFYTAFKRLYEGVKSK